MLLDVKALRAKLGLSRDLTYALMKAKNFPSMQIGGRYYVSEEALAKWLERHEGKKVVL